eukprot:sb/3476707/
MRHEILAAGPPPLISIQMIWGWYEDRHEKVLWYKVQRFGLRHYQENIPYKTIPNSLLYEFPFIEPIVKTWDLPGGEPPVSPAICLLRILTARVVSSAELLSVCSARVVSSVALT